STVVAAFRLERRGGKVAELRAAYGGLAARAMRAVSVEGAVKGRPWAPAWLADIDAVLARDFTPVADHRGGAPYRGRPSAGRLRGGGAVAPLPARNVLGGADAGGRAMNEVAARIRGAVHAAVGHDSAVAHVTGAARYLDDVPVVPGTLEAALVLSPHAHARI